MIPPRFGTFGRGMFSRLAARACRLPDAERLAKRRRGVAYAFAVADEHDVGLESPELPSRREGAQERMQAERGASEREVADGAERVGCDEDAPVGPPQRALVQQRHVHDRDDLEWRIDS